jgi:pimeloyl-ACP methyl ester carboxylesterase
VSIAAPQTEQRFVTSSDGVRIASYTWGDPLGAPVVAVHGFASSAVVNWQATGWVRDLGRAGFRIIAFDLRGHGESEKPERASSYSMDAMLADLAAVLDAYTIETADYVGYSLGARIGWQAAISMPGRFRRIVLGGIPDGDPLVRFRIDQARQFLSDGTPIDDRMTRRYVEMASGIPDNDIPALLSLIEGMRGGVMPNRANPPLQPALFATGSEDLIVEESKGLAEAAPNGRFVEIPGRGHFNAPTSRVFRQAAIEFLQN